MEPKRKHLDNGVSIWTIEAGGEIEVRTYPSGGMLEVTRPFDQYEDAADVMMDEGQLRALSVAALEAAERLAT